MYQFSLEWFGKLIGSTVERIEKTGKSEQRCETISDSLLRNFFTVTGYGLSTMVGSSMFGFTVAETTCTSR